MVSFGNPTNHNIFQPSTLLYKIFIESLLSICDSCSEFVLFWFPFILQVLDSSLPFSSLQNRQYQWRTRSKLDFLFLLLFCRLFKCYYPIRWFVLRSFLSQNSKCGLPSSFFPRTPCMNPLHPY